ncbi:MAG: Ig-like domain-containing protein, partial [Fidelibacterota bacterium]
LDSLFSDIDGELTYSVELMDPTVIHAEIESSFLSLSSLPNAFGETIMTVTASNPMRASISDTVTVVVFAENDAPVFTEMEPIVLNEDETILLSSIIELQEAGIFEDVDTELADLTFDLFSNNDHILINWDGSVSSNPELIPAPNYFGESTLTLCVTDG